MESTILIVCKILGTGLAVVMGVLGILFETHDKVISKGLVKKRRLNKVGRIFLALTIISGTIALTAQIIEATNNRTKELENKARDQAVLENLSVSVDGIRRVVEQIHIIDSRITIPLNETNDLFHALRSYLANRALPFTNHGSLSQDKLDAMLHQNPGIRFTRIVSYDGRYPDLAFDLITNSSPTAFVAEPEFRPVYDLLQTLASENHQLRFYRQSPSGSSESSYQDHKEDYKLVDSSGRCAVIKAHNEILCATSPKLFTAKLLYEPGTGRMELLFGARFSSDSWTRCQPIISFVDLSNATFLLALPEPNNGVFKSEKLTAADMLIDGIRFLLPDLKILKFSVTATGTSISGGYTVGTIIPDWEHDRDASVTIPTDAKIFTATLPDLE